MLICACSPEARRKLSRWACRGLLAVLGPLEFCSATVHHSDGTHTKQSGVQRLLVLPGATCWDFINHCRDFVEHGGPNSGCLRKVYRALVQGIMAADEVRPSPAKLGACCEHERVVPGIVAADGACLFLAHTSPSRSGTCASSQWLFGSVCLLPHVCGLHLQPCLGAQAAVSHFSPPISGRGGGAHWPHALPRRAGRAVCRLPPGRTRRQAIPQPLHSAAPG